MARTTYANGVQMGHVLAALMPTNALVVRACIKTGLRISDVLSLKTCDLKPRQTVRESKTGKSRRVEWGQSLYHEMLGQAGDIWVFEGRTDPKRHRTRQTVYKDIKHAEAVYKRSGRHQAGGRKSQHTEQGRQPARAIRCHSLMERFHRHHTLFKRAVCLGRQHLQPFQLNLRAEGVSPVCQQPDNVYR